MEKTGLAETGEIPSMASPARNRNRSRHHLLFIISLFFACESTEADPNSPPPSAAPMMLPLFLSPANSSRLQELDERRRRTSEKSEATMRLYDDLPTEGYYSTRVYIGTPPRKFALIVDTGSTVTYVPCSTCTHCGIHQDPSFHPELSSSYQPLKCDMFCSRCSEENQCIYENKYAEMSSSIGVLGEDTISFGEESSLKLHHAVFGCENRETGDIYTQKADGIIGLGRGRLSIMDQLVAKGVISDSFSLCYGGMGIGGGVMVLGEVPHPQGMVYAHSDPARSQHYDIELKNIHVSGRPLDLNPSIFDSHQTIMDSGTTFAYIPKVAFLAFKDAIIKHLKSPKQIPGEDPKVKDVCFSGLGSDISELPKIFPKVDMIFGDGQRISLSPENYLFRHSKVHGAYCLGIFPNTKYASTLLGGVIVRNMLVTYDRKNNRIGFWKTNCSELWDKTQHTQFPLKNSTLGVSPTTSPAPTESRSSSRCSSMSSPTGLQNFDFTENSQIGRIRLDMCHGIKYTDLVNNTTELTEVMSFNLKINVSQIRMASFQTEGDGSIIKWMIFPAESCYYISNSTAKDIIFHLFEHSFHLPEKFGSYQLLEWKVEPLHRRTWWLEQFLAIILVSLVVIILASSIPLVLYWYRTRDRSGGSYRPVVDASVSEQELQEL